MANQIIAGRKTGIRKAGSGEPAVLLHCSLAHSGAWSGIMAGLADHLSMTAIDLPGHGETVFDATMDVQDQACETTIEVLEGLEGPVHLIGHSFGATVALRCAIMRPELVASLSLYEPVYFSLLAKGNPDAYAAEAVESATFTDYAMAKDWRNATIAFLGRWGSNGGFSAMPEAMQNYVVMTIPLIIENNRSVIEDREGGVTLDDIAQIKVPCLLMEGANSPNSIEKVNDLLESALPIVERKVFKNASHMGPISHAPEISGSVKSFLFSGSF